MLINHQTIEQMREIWYRIAEKNSIPCFCLFLSNSSSICPLSEIKASTSAVVQPRLPSTLAWCFESFFLLGFPWTICSSVVLGGLSACPGDPGSAAPAKSLEWNHMSTWFIQEMACFNTQNRDSLFSTMYPMFLNNKPTIVDGTNCEYWPIQVKRISQVVCASFSKYDSYCWASWPMTKIKATCM